MDNYWSCTVALLLATTNIHCDAMSGSENKNTASSASFSTVSLAKPDHLFEASVSALLLQPTSGNLDYAAEAIPIPLASPNWKIHQIDTDYNFGFDAEIRGIFRERNTDLSLDWEHFHSVDEASKQVSSSNMIGPFFEIGPDASPYKKARGKVVFQFDKVELNYGIFVNFGKHLQTNLFTGLSFAQIKQTLFSKFSDFTGEIVRTITTPSRFIGAGPQAGVDFAYRIIAGLGISGTLKASFLVGQQKNHTKYLATSPALAGLGVSSPNMQKTSTHQKTQVVPGLEGKLGLSYTFNIRKLSFAKLEAGYQVQTFIDAIQSINIGSEVVTPPVAPDTVGVFARTFEQTHNNFSLAGPYLMFGVGF
ncbi:MAG: Lpg1974 family pore-forming outer membrane protein [Chlamydiales bacterium]